MIRLSSLTALALMAGCASPVQTPQTFPVPAAAPSAQEGAAAAAVIDRPLPAPIVPPPAFRSALAEGTRSPSGRPGPAYWQNSADYRIVARLSPQRRRLDGTAEIRYHNRSPDALDALVVDLVQNFHAPDAERLERVEVTGGMELSRVAVAGQTLSEGVGTGRYTVDGTKLVIAPGRAVRPNETVELAIDWGFTIPEAGAGGRMGYSGDNLFFLAYFYPQMAVYDDVVGWHMDQFLGTSEFYSPFGSYDVTIEAPAGWLVTGTGTLTNEAEVLAPQVFTRLRAAEASDTVVRVLTPADVGQPTRATSGTVRWTFRADSVRDVAYGLTRESLWDAVRTPVGDRNGDGQQEYARVGAVYRANATRWRNAARYGQHAVAILSRFTGYNYPWPHMTAVEGAGIIGGGMEYPMMTLIGDYSAAGDVALYDVTAHEIAHMWVPMIVGSDERRYAWLDEGTTNFNEHHAHRDIITGPDPELADRNAYLTVAQRGDEGEMMRRSNYHYSSTAYVVATYYKPATVLAALRGVLGEETFLRAYREFIDRWAFKHPYPWDMWNTFEDVSGRDLDWFWHSWYHETWLLDQAVESVTSVDGAAEIIVRDHGDVPMPARVTITFAGGERLQREVPVETWLSGARTASIRVTGAPTRVEVDAENHFPDANRENNVWTR